MGRRAWSWRPSDSGGAHATPSQRSERVPPRHNDLFRPEPHPVHDRDAANLEELVRPHHDALHDFLRRLTDDEETATSMLKETMYRALADADSVPRRPSAVRAWLVLIACAALRDGERLAPAGHDDRPVTLMSARMIEPLAPAPATQVERAINNLSPAHRELILDVAYRGKGLEQIAAIREESVPAVKSDLHAAMRFLRKNLENG